MCVCFLTFKVTKRITPIGAALKSSTPGATCCCSDSKRGKKKKSSSRWITCGKFAVVLDRSVCLCIRTNQEGTTLKTHYGVWSATLSHIRMKGRLQYRELRTHNKTVTTERGAPRSMVTIGAMTAHSSLAWGVCRQRCGIFARRQNFHLEFQSQTAS